MDRKTFIQLVVRGGILSALALVTGTLLSRRQVSLSRECDTGLPCRNCRKFERCSLPKADKERSYEKG